jgi:glycosyltransferase involved in cell wall biosynthesis
LADGFVAHAHEVLYLSGPMNIYNIRYFLSDDPSTYDLKYALAIWRSGGLREASNLLSYAPMTLIPIWRKWPFSTEWVARHTLDFTLPNVYRYLKHRQFYEPDVLLVSQPFFMPLLKRVYARSRVYRLTDDIDKFPNIPTSVKYMEREAVKQADAVVVTASPLIDKVKAYGAKRVIYIPNGVDVTHYQSQQPRPAEYKDLNGPIVVYMGAIDSWFDVDMLAHCACALPGSFFVLIGASRINLERLLKLPNVCYLGRKDYTALLGYLQHANVGIIPFRRTPLVESISPLKLYEYMACGLPVVATRWRELEQTGAPAYLISGRDDFLAGVQAALSENGTRREVYLDFAMKNSWVARGRQLQELFEDLWGNFKA